MLGNFLTWRRAALALLGGAVVGGAAYGALLLPDARAEVSAHIDAGCPLGNQFFPDNAFCPPSVPSPFQGTGIPVGGSVEFELLRAGETHTVTMATPGIWFGNKPFDVTLNAGNRTAVAGPFNLPGTYYFYCRNHGDPNVGSLNFNPYTSMVGKIVVGAGGPAPTLTVTPLPTNTPTPTMTPTITPTPEATATTVPVPTPDPGRSFIPGASATDSD